MKQKFLAGLIIIFLFGGVFFLGRLTSGSNESSSTTTTSEVAQTEVINSSTTEIPYNKKTTLQLEEEDQQLIEKYVRAIHSSNEEGLKLLESIQANVKEDLYKSEYANIKDRIKVNKVLNFVVNKVTMYQHLSYRDMYMVIVETQMSDREGTHEPHYPYYFITVTNHVIDDVRMAHVHASH